LAFSLRNAVGVQHSGWIQVNSDSYTSEEKKIARALLRYLEKAPEANDTLKGIAQWWLLQHWRDRAESQLQRAVSFLLSQDLLVETRRAGLPPFYRLNPVKREGIIRILKDL
jgi:hypothetical protein